MVDHGHTEKWRKIMAENAEKQFKQPELPLGSTKFLDIAEDGDVRINTSHKHVCEVYMGRNTLFTTRVGPNQIPLGECWLSTFGAMGTPKTMLRVNILGAYMRKFSNFEMCEISLELVDNPDKVVA